MAINYEVVVLITPKAHCLPAVFHNDSISMEQRRFVKVGRLKVDAWIYKVGSAKVELQKMSFERSSCCPPRFHWNGIERSYGDDCTFKIELEL